MLLENDIKCKPFIATEVVDGVTYTLRIARATDRVSTIIKASDGRYFRDANTHFLWGSGASDNEIIMAQIHHVITKINASNDLFHKVWLQVAGCYTADMRSPWVETPSRYDFLLMRHFGYTFADVDNMSEGGFEKFIKSKINDATK